jgi:hypothetical protein
MEINNLLVINEKNLLFLLLFSIFTYTISADDLADLLQDLAVQTACLGRYSSVQANKYVTTKYNDPPDYYDPPMLANRFAAMSGDMTRTITFYGVCFDYAQFAWNDIKEYQKMYNNAGMKDQQWYIASTEKNEPYNIILYDPVSREKATVIMNGVYLKENSRHKIYAHDGAEGHAWIWVQHKNGTWYWIDPTWTDNTGYVWWGIVQNGVEVQYYPEPDLCAANNYPRPYVASDNYRPSTANSGKQNSKPTYTEKPKPEKPKPSPSNNNYGYSDYRYDFLLGYNYSSEMPFGFMIGLSGLYASMNIGFRDDPNLKTDPGGSSGTLSGMELLGGFSFNIYRNRLYLLIGAGVSYTLTEKEIITGWWSGSDGSGNYYGTGTEEKTEFTLEIGLQPIVFKHVYLSTTYRLTGFSKSGFSLGTGFVF